MAKILVKRVYDYEDYEKIKEFAEEAVGLFLNGRGEASLYGKKVLLKPNLLMKKPPEAAVTTHPHVVKAFAEVLSAMGANLYLGDSPGGKNTEASFKRSLKVSGLQGVVEEFAIKEVFFDGMATEINIGGKLKTTLEIFKPDGFDLIVNLCKFKTHGFMGLTCAVKNLFGFVVGTAKAQCHLRFPEPKVFADMLLDLALYLKPSLNIVDGIVSMDREGPSSGRPVKTGFLVASNDPFALDFYLASTAGLELNRIYTVKASLERGLLDKDPELIGDSLEIKNFEMPEKTRVLSGSGVFKWLRNQLTALPYYDRKTCRRCYECLKNCPPQVIGKNKEGFPVLEDSDRCIRCYCCVELCPYGAAKIKQPLLLKIFKRLL
jgi:uncharacterized protein (DUF362 family)/NAD-dependent dihydropyrimidine dehydrogenase PreA subunit